MGLEANFNYIDDLDIANPNNTPDQLAEADDHLRGIKSSVKGSFPNLGQAAVTLTAAEMNALLTQIAPIGSILMFTGTITSLPANWHLCDGTGGAIDLNDRFVIGTNVQGEIGDTGGTSNSVVVSHTHTDTFATSLNGTHAHNLDFATGTGGGLDRVTGSLDAAAGGSTDTSGVIATSSHTHGITGSVDTEGVTGIGANLPPYYVLAYIQRLS